MTKVARNDAECVASGQEWGKSLPETFFLLLVYSTDEDGDDFDVNPV